MNKKQVYKRRVDEKEVKKWRKVAIENGIKREAYNSRVRKLGWSPEKAATTKARKLWFTKELKETAKKNDVSESCVYNRVNKLGWDVKDAVTISNVDAAYTRNDYKWIIKAKENGISRKTYIGRVDVQGWTPEKAATVPPIVRDDRKWASIARKNGIDYNTYYHRVDELFWNPEQAAIIPPQPFEDRIEELVENNKQLWRIKQERNFRDPDNLYTVTPQHIEIAKQNGISKGTVEGRVYSLGWTVQDAITIPTLESSFVKPPNYEYYRKTALTRGINRVTFSDRVKRGWDLGNAASLNPVYKHRRQDQRFIESAKKNGINKNTYMARVDRLFWPKEIAANLPPLEAGEFLNEENRKNAREGFSKHRSDMVGR